MEQLVRMECEGGCEPGALSGGRSLECTMAAVVDKKCRKNT